MKKGKLYLICPDCHLEYALRDTFSQDAYFLTALGAVFDFSKVDYVEVLNQFINREMISEIIIVNDINCTFIKNVIFRENNYNTRAEHELEKLKKNNAEKFFLLDTNKQKQLLAKLNIYRQAYELSDIDFMYGKINHKIISISGLIHDRDNASFERLNLKL